MHAQPTLAKPPRNSVPRSQRRKSRSFQSRALEEWTRENALYEVEFSDRRGRQTALRRQDTWSDEHGLQVGVSEEIQAIYFPARHA